MSYEFSREDDDMLRAWPRARSKQRNDREYRVEAFRHFAAKGIPESAVYSRLAWLRDAGQVMDVQARLPVTENALNSALDKIKALQRQMGEMAEVSMQYIEFNNARAANQQNAIDAILARLEVPPPAATSEDDPIARFQRLVNGGTPNG